jgi:hypothetical protein
LQQQQQQQGQRPHHSQQQQQQPAAAAASGTAVQLGDALLLYLKALGLVKRAVELGRVHLLGDVLHPTHGPLALAAQAEQASAAAAAAVGKRVPQRVGGGLEEARAQGAERAQELLQWLSSQFALVLERAQQCRSPTPPRSSSSASSSSSSGTLGQTQPGPQPPQQPEQPPDPPQLDQQQQDQHGRVEQRIYAAALQLARTAAVKEVLGHTEVALKMYRHGKLLVDALLLLEPNLEAGDRAVLAGYDRGFQSRITELQQQQQKQQQQQQATSAAAATTPEGTAEPATSNQSSEAATPSSPTRGESLSPVALPPHTDSDRGPGGAPSAGGERGASASSSPEGEFAAASALGEGSASSSMIVPPPEAMLQPHVMQIDDSISATLAPLSEPPSEPESPGSPLRGGGGGGNAGAGDNGSPQDQAPVAFRLSEGIEETFDHEDAAFT